jgi:hypothetical protein
MGRGLNPAGSQQAAGMEGHWDRQAGFLQPAIGAAAAAAGPGPQVARLKRLLQTGQVGRKMDWFDPTLLQKMVRLTLTAATIDMHVGSAAAQTH